MKFNPLNLKYKTIFNKYLSINPHPLSAYSFENIFLWKSLYDIFWIKINNSLCVFFKDKIGCFLYLPPLGERINIEIIKSCFEIMNRFNKNEEISRIENVCERDLGFYKNLGFKTTLAGGDYICKRSDLVNLSGNDFKAKRYSSNFFRKNYHFAYLPYEIKDEKECISLYELWMKERKKKQTDSIYQRLLEDNFSIFKTALTNYKKLNFISRVIKIKGKIKAITLGYPLNKKTFVVLFEVCDLSFKGIAQYIFREFCREINYQDINIMDDSGLENLKKVKLSYKPYKIEESFIVKPNPNPHWPNPHWPNPHWNWVNNVNDE